MAPHDRPSFPSYGPPLMVCTIVPRSVPSDSAHRSSPGLTPQKVPSALTGPLLSPRVFSHGFLVLQVPLLQDAFLRLSWPHPKAHPLHSPQGLIPSLFLRRRSLPALACSPPAPSPAAASPSARWAPGTGRSPPSWCRQESGPGAGRSQESQQDRAGQRPQEPSWVV